MLDLAINHVPQLQAEFRKTLFKERYKYYFRTPAIDYFIPVSNNSDHMQFVSIDEYGRVIGYLAVKINPITKTGYDVSAINFQDRESPIFTQDLYDFYCKLFFDFGLNRLVWSVVEENPADGFFKRLTMFGVREVGVFKDDVMLYDGKLYNLKYYECMKEDFKEKMLDKGYTAQDYRQISKGGEV